MVSLEWTEVTILVFHALFAPTVGRRERIMYQHSVSLTSPDE